MNWHFLRSGRQPAALNMAVDEALLANAAALGEPVLRSYGWVEPAATFGYSQPYAQVAAWTRLRPLIRRPTGGGLVPHDADWTYSVVFPPPHPCYRMKAVESYRWIHEWLQRALSRTGVASELAPIPVKTAPGQCFAGAEKWDLLLDGAKIAGAAQRRTRSGLLVQGSIQPRGSGAKREAWEQAMLETVSPPGDANWVTFLPGPDFEAQAGALAAEKSSQPWHNERR
ncbi:MAG: lipoate--protein ligase family protein [Verrucomicrobiia bacterium]